MRSGGLHDSRGLKGSLIQAWRKYQEAMRGGGLHDPRALKVSLYQARRT
jgi:hypothetical protein